MIDLLVQESEMNSGWHFELWFSGLYLLNWLTIWYLSIIYGYCFIPYRLEWHLSVFYSYGWLWSCFCGLDIFRYGLDCLGRSDMGKCVIWPLAITLVVLFGTCGIIRVGFTVLESLWSLDNIQQLQFNRYNFHLQFGIVHFCNVLISHFSFWMIWILASPILLFGHIFTVNLISWLMAFWIWLLRFSLVWLCNYMDSFLVWLYRWSSGLAICVPNDLSSVVCYVQHTAASV